MTEHEDAGSDISLMMTGGRLRGAMDGCAFAVALVAVELCLKQVIFQFLGQ